ncbi:MAG: monofunctional biosynthetic peptidoglycan transglycosylase [Rhizobiales bacterium]|nr:monofunctional biosynthetic peptidoglycan transglycosylase [Hyphomicrobiales bacterium]
MAATSHRSPLRLMIRILLRLLIIIMMVPIVLVPLYAVTPSLSTLMLRDIVSLKGYDRQWVAYDDIARVAVHSVLVSEDSRHCEHSGVDWIEFNKAWQSVQDGGKGRGASTIVMQTVKNLFLWNSRSYIRKAIELPLALYADLIWSKKRSIEIYLNIAEWGDGIYGIEAAARHYFKVPAAKLTRRQAALLAVTLPSPLKRNPAKPSRGLDRLASKIVNRAGGAGPYVTCLPQ